MSIVSTIFSFLFRLIKPAFRTRRRTIISLLIIIVLGYLYFRRSRLPTDLKTALVERTTFSQVVVASGQVKARQQATLNFSTPGKIAWVAVKKGDQVRAWQGLIGLDTTELNAAATAAWYNYLAADANAKEIEDDVKDHDSDETFAQKNLRVAAQTTRDKAWDAHLVAQKALKDATLVAPFSGVITELTASAVGDTVGLADGLTITNLGSLYFQAEVDEIDYYHLAPDLMAEVKLDAFPDQLFTGKVSSIAKTGQETSGGGINILVDITLNPHAENLIPNLNGEARLIISQKPNSLVIPREFLLIKDNQYFVNLKQDNRTEEHPVEVGETTLDSAEIISGLTEGQIITLAQ